MYTECEIDPRSAGAGAHPIYPEVSKKYHLSSLIRSGEVVWCAEYLLDFGAEGAEDQEEANYSARHKVEPTAISASHLCHRKGKRLCFRCHM